jgi:DNA polymerase-3 subunit chi
MAEIKFYLLSGTGTDARYRYACKIIEKAYRNGYFAYVLTDSDSQSQWLEQLLWIFRPTSFVPHEIYRGTLPEFPNTILISHLPIPRQWQRLVVNLSSNFVTDLAQTEKVVEIFDNDEQIKQIGREHYRHYKSLGIIPTTHSIQ